MSAAGPIVVLLSIARHPVSGRRVASHADRAALELALRLGGTVRGLHAGDAGEPALKDFLRMGLGELDVISAAISDGIAAPMAAHLASLRPCLILAGATAGSGRGSGMLPYALAEGLRIPLVAGVRGLKPGGEGWIAEIGVGPGRIQRLGCASPCLAIVDERSLVPRYGSFAASQSGRVLRSAVKVSAPGKLEAQFVAARRRPLPIEPVRGENAVARLERISGGNGGRTSSAVPMSPREASQAILAALRERALGPFASNHDGDGS